MSNIKYKIDHKTVYKYVNPVVQSHHIIHMSPRTISNQVIINHDLKINPKPASRNDYFDYNQNPTSIITIEKEHSELNVHSHCEIEIQPTNHREVSSSPTWEETAETALYSNNLEILQYTCLSKHTQLTIDVLEYAQTSFTQGRAIHEATLDLTSRIFNEFAFDNSATDVSTPISEVMKIKRGVCQDFAHLQIACIRALRLPARYVSGYILTKPPEGMPKLAGTDASHAWVSVWCGNELGWIDFDPTNNMIPHDEHIAIAYGMDYDDVSPISGVLIGGGEHNVNVGVDVVPVT